MRRIGSLGAVLVVVAALIVAGCSSEPDEAQDAPDPTETDDGSVDRPADGGSTEEDSSGSTEGGSSGSGSVEVSDEARPYVDAMAASFSSDDGNDMGMDSAQVDCISARWVEIIGVDRFEEAGITPEDISADVDQDFVGLDFDEAEGNQLYDAFGSCDIDLREGVVAAMTQGEEMSAEARECVDQVFSEDNLRTFFVGALVLGDDGAQDDPAVAEIMQAMMGCALMDME